MDIFWRQLVHNFKSSDHFCKFTFKIEYNIRMDSNLYILWGNYIYSVFIFLYSLLYIIKTYLILIFQYFGFLVKISIYTQKIMKISTRFNDLFNILGIVNAFFFFFKVDTDLFYKFLFVLILNILFRTYI